MPPNIQVDVIEWRPVVGYEGLYEVSSGGQVRSLPRTITTSHGVTKRLRGTVLKPQSNPNGGYPQVDLWRDGDRQSAFVNTLVLTAFRGARPTGMESCHRNGDPGYNVTMNLRWGSASENAQDMVRHGTHINARKQTCPRGHELADWNNTGTAARAGWRECLACSRGKSCCRESLKRGVELDRKAVADRYYRVLQRENGIPPITIIPPADLDEIRNQAADTERDFWEAFTASLDADLVSAA